MCISSTTVLANITLQVEAKYIGVISTVLNDNCTNTVREHGTDQDVYGKRSISDISLLNNR